MTRSNVFKLCSILGVSIVVLLSLSVLSSAVESYRVTKSGTNFIFEHYVCRVVANNRVDYDIFVPTKTSAEWGLFRNSQILSSLNVIVGECQIVNNVHTSVECTSAGGLVIYDELGNRMCKFDLSACPTGWTQYGKWSTTSPNSATYTNEVVIGACTLGCIQVAKSQECGTASAVCATSWHIWGNQDVESKTCSGTQASAEGWGESRTSYFCHVPPILIVACGAYEPCTGATSVTVNSSITQIGCY